MPGRGLRAVLLLGIAVSLGLAAVEARNLGHGAVASDPCASRPPDPVAVEASFGPILTARDQGRPEEALLLLRERTERGPYPGYAWFLLGEMAFGEGQARAAVRHYRRAVEADPSVGDRQSAFRARRVVTERLAGLRTGPWAQDPPPEIRDLYFLQRRLAGGCQ